MEILTCRACEHYGDPHEYSIFPKDHVHYTRSSECTINGKHIIHALDYQAYDKCDKWECYD